MLTRFTVHSQIRYVPGNTPFNVLIHTARNSDMEGREHDAKRTSIFVFLLFSGSLQPRSVRNH